MISVRPPPWKVVGNQVASVVPQHLPNTTWPETSRVWTEA